MSKYGELLVFVSAFLYGCNPLISKSIYLYGGTPITLVFFRLLIGSLGMGVLHFLCYKDSVMLPKSQLKNALICSFVQLPSYCGVLIITFLPVSLQRLIFLIPPWYCLEVI